MTSQDFQDRMDLALEGGASTEEIQALLEAAGRDPLLAKQLQEAAVLDALLRAENHDADRFARHVMQHVTHQGDENIFASRMRTLAERKSRFDRRLRLRSAGRVQLGPWLVAAVLALVVLPLGVLMVLGFGDDAAEAPLAAEAPRPMTPLRSPRLPVGTPGQPAPQNPSDALVHEPLPPDLAPSQDATPSLRDPSDPVLAEVPADQPAPPPDPGDFAAWARLEVVVQGLRVMRHGEALPMAAGLVLRSGDLLRRDSDSDPGEVRVRFADGTTLEMAADTILRLGDEQGAKRVELNTGLIVCQASRQPTGKPLMLTTREGRFVVVGTRFSIEAGMNRSVLKVTEGTVRAIRSQDGASVAVRAGFYTVVSAAERMVIRPIPAEGAPDPTGPRVVRVSLIRPGAGQVFRGYENIDHAVIDLSRIPGAQAAFLIQTEPQNVGPVIIEFNGRNRGGASPEENAPPYSYPRDENNVFSGLTLTAGSHILTVDRVDAHGARHRIGIVRFTVVDRP